MESKDIRDETVQKKKKKYDKKDDEEHIKDDEEHIKDDEQYQLVHFYKKGEHKARDKLSVKDPLIQLVESTKGNRLLASLDVAKGDVKNVMADITSRITIYEQSNGNGFLNELKFLRLWYNKQINGTSYLKSKIEKAFQFRLKKNKREEKKKLDTLKGHNEGIKLDACDNQGTLDIDIDQTSFLQILSPLGPICLDCGKVDGKDCKKCEAQDKVNLNKEKHKKLFKNLTLSSNVIKNGLLNVVQSNLKWETLREYIVTGKIPIPKQIVFGTTEKLSLSKISLSSARGGEEYIGFDSYMKEYIFKEVIRKIIKNLTQVFIRNKKKITSTNAIKKLIIGILFELNEIIKTVSGYSPKIKKVKAKENATNTNGEILYKMGSIGRFIEIDADINDNINNSINDIDKLKKLNLFEINEHNYIYKLFDLYKEVKDLKVDDIKNNIKIDLDNIFATVDWSSHYKDIKLQDNYRSFRITNANEMLQYNGAGDLPLPIIPFRTYYESKQQFIFYEEAEDEEAEDEEAADEDAESNFIESQMIWPWPKYHTDENAAEVAKAGIPIRELILIELKELVKLGEKNDKMFEFYWLVDIPSKLDDLKTGMITTTDYHGEEITIQVLDDDENKNKNTIKKYKKKPRNKALIRLKVRYFDYLSADNESEIYKQWQTNYGAAKKHGLIGDSFKATKLKIAIGVGRNINKVTLPVMLPIIYVPIGIIGVVVGVPLFYIAKWTAMSPKFIGSGVKWAGKKTGLTAFAGKVSAKTSWLYNHPNTQYRKFIFNKFSIPWKTYPHKEAWSDGGQKKYLLKSLLKPTKIRALDAIHLLIKGNYFDKNHNSKSYKAKYFKHAIYNLQDDEYTNFLDQIKKYIVPSIEDNGKKYIRKYNIFFHYDDSRRIQFTEEDDKLKQICDDSCINRFYEEAKLAKIVNPCGSTFCYANVENAKEGLRSKQKVLNTFFLEKYENTGFITDPTKKVFLNSENTQYADGFSNIIQFTGTKNFPGIITQKTKLPDAKKYFEIIFNNLLKPEKLKENGKLIFNNICLDFTVIDDLILIFKKLKYADVILKNIKIVNTEAISIYNILYIIYSSGVKFNNLDITAVKDSNKKELEDKNERKVISKGVQAYKINDRINNGKLRKLFFGDKKWSDDDVKLIIEWAVEHGYVHDKVGSTFRTAVTNEKALDNINKLTDDYKKDIAKALYDIFLEKNFKKSDFVKTNIRHGVEPDEPLPNPYYAFVKFDKFDKNNKERLGTYRKLWSEPNTTSNKFLKRRFNYKNYEKFVVDNEDIDKVGNKNQIMVSDKDHALNFLKFGLKKKEKDKTNSDYAEFLANNEKLNSDNKKVKEIIKWAVEHGYVHKTLSRTSTTAVTNKEALNDINKLDYQEQITIAKELHAHIFEQDRQKIFERMGSLTTLDKFEIHSEYYINIYTEFAYFDKIMDDKKRQSFYRKLWSKRVSPVSILTKEETNENELVFAKAHFRIAGAAVIYTTNSKKKQISGLKNGNTYYVLKGEAENTMQLAETRDGNAIEISGGSKGNKITTVPLLRNLNLKENNTFKEKRKKDKWNTEYANIKGTKETSEIAALESVANTALEEKSFVDGMKFVGGDFFDKKEIQQIGDISDGSKYFAMIAFMLGSSKSDTMVNDSGDEINSVKTDGIMISNALNFESLSLPQQFQNNYLINSALKEVNKLRAEKNKSHLIINFQSPEKKTTKMDNAATQSKVLFDHLLDENDGIPKFKKALSEIREALTKEKLKQIVRGNDVLAQLKSILTDKQTDTLSPEQQKFKVDFSIIRDIFIIKHENKKIRIDTYKEKARQLIEELKTINSGTKSGFFIKSMDRQETEERLKKGKKVLKNLEDLHNDYTNYKEGGMAGGGIISNLKKKYEKKVKEKNLKDSDISSKYKESNENLDSSPLFRQLINYLEEFDTDRRDADANLNLLDKSLDPSSLARGYDDFEILDTIIEINNNNPVMTRLKEIGSSTGIKELIMFYKDGVSGCWVYPPKKFKSFADEVKGKKPITIKFIAPTSKKKKKDYKDIMVRKAKEKRVAIEDLYKINYTNRTGKKIEGPRGSIPPQKIHLLHPHYLRTLKIDCLYSDGIDINETVRLYLFDKYTDFEDSRHKDVVRIKVEAPKTTKITIEQIKQNITYLIKNNIILPNKVDVMYSYKQQAIQKGKTKIIEMMEKLKHIYKYTAIYASQSSHQLNNIIFKTNPSGWDNFYRECTISSLPLEVDKQKLDNMFIFVVDSASSTLRLNEKYGTLFYNFSSLKDVQVVDTNIKNINKVLFNKFNDYWGNNSDAANIFSLKFEGYESGVYILTIKKLQELLDDVKNEATNKAKMVEEEKAMKEEKAVEKGEEEERKSEDRKKSFKSMDKRVQEEADKQVKLIKSEDKAHVNQVVKNKGYVEEIEKEEKFQRSKKSESDIIARVEAAGNKITINDDDGNVYYGQMEGDKPHGYGTFTFADGGKYVGEYKNGEGHGYGTRTYDDGQKYVGEWKNDKKNGQGTQTYDDGTIFHSGEWVEGETKTSGNESEDEFEDDIDEKTASLEAPEDADQHWPNLAESDIIARVEAAGNKITKNYKSGSVYHGQMKTYKRHGYGTRTYADGQKYVGEWKNGKQDGNGILTGADGTILHSGEWENGRKGNSYGYTTGEKKTNVNESKYEVEGKDNRAEKEHVGVEKTLISSTGKRYVGKISEGDEKKGKGRFTCEETGAIYDGEFQLDKMHGNGTYTWASGSKYVGEMKDGNFHGHGIKTFADGEKYVGEWKNDKKDGHGTYTYANGNKYVGEFKNDKRDGNGTWTWASGTIYHSGEWVNGKRGSEREEVDTNGESAEEVTNEDIEEIMRGTIEPGSKLSEKEKKLIKIMKKARKKIHKYKSELIEKEKKLIKIMKKARKKHKYKSGDTYYGKKVNDERQGYGTYLWKNGDTYVGKSKKGKKTGYGEMMSEDSYKGHFKNDEKDGYGEMTYANGDKYVGNFKNDEKDGYGEMTYANGAKFVGNFKNNIAVKDEGEFTPAETIADVDVVI